MQRPWLIVLAVAAALCACGQPVDGNPVAGVPGSEDQFDPCTIPDQAIQATGLDPGSKRAGFGEGTSVEDWTLCTWAGPPREGWYYFGVLFSMQYTIGDVRQNPSYVDFVDVEMGSRDALRFNFDVGDRNGSCDAAFETEEGLVRLSVTTMGGLNPKTDPCELLLHHAADLETHLPPST